MTASEAASMWDQTGATAMIPYQVPDPATLPKEEFEFTLTTIEIQGNDLARVDMSELTGDEEDILIKVGDRWYIAGSKWLKTNF